MTAEALHVEILRALSIAATHGSKTAAARALGYTPQAYNGVLSEELSPSLLRRLLVKRCKVSMEIDPEGDSSIDYTIEPAPYRAPTGRVAFEHPELGWLELPEEYVDVDEDDITAEDVERDGAIRRLTVDEICDLTE